jgi:pyrimidine-nucleoside phosphorylase
MRAVDIIRRKRDGSTLSPEEIRFFVRGYAAGRIPDYQASAFAMAVFFRGMTDPEMAALAVEMRDSGRVIDLSSLAGRKVDKHSTGGVGDKTSLVLAPSVAAAGVLVPMMSGRGLGHTGGTLDKLESIPGFNVRLSPERFSEMLSRVGASLIGQTEDLVPADRKLYALRDVTATVESIPLISASIMSKKLAEGIDGLVLDVKTGSGAFMKSGEDAERLARALVGIGRSAGKKVVAVITDMNQPLGEWIGNALEVVECVEVLRGRGPADLCRLCEELSAWCLVLGERTSDVEDARRLYREVITSGRALAKFREIVEYQGGDPGVVDDYSRLPVAARREELPSPGTGYVEAIDTEAVGTAMCVLGAGRETVDSEIDPAVGMRVRKKIGDAVVAGESLGTVYFNDGERYRQACERLLAAYRFSKERPDRPVLIKKTIGTPGGDE